MPQVMHPFSGNAAHFSNNTDQFGFDAELHQRGKNKADLFHFHDFYEFVIYLGERPARYRLLDREYEVNFGDIVRCDLMDEHMWLVQENDQHMRFSVGLTFNFVTSCSTKNDNLIQIFSRNGNSYPVLHLGSMDIHKYIDLINAFQECDLEHGKMVFQLGILHQMLAYLQDDFLRFNSDGATLTRQDNLVCELINYINLHIGDGSEPQDIGPGDQLQPHLPLPHLQEHHPQHLEAVYRRKAHQHGDAPHGEGDAPDRDRHGGGLPELLHVLQHLPPDHGRQS